MDDETAIMRQRGTRIFGCPVNVHIDPTLEGLLGSYGVDEEGVAGKRFQVVREGKLHDVMLGRKAAAFFRNQQPSGPTGSMRLDYYDDTFDDEMLHFDPERESTIPEERTSNMVATALDPKPINYLHNKARSEARKRKLDFYVVIDSVHGAEIIPGDGAVTAYNVLGRTVSLKNGTSKPFRGVHARGNALDITNSIVAMSGNNTEPWHGICGGPSGDVAVTEFAPSAVSTGISLHQTLGESLFDDDDEMRRGKTKGRRRAKSRDRRVKTRKKGRVLR